MDKKTTAEWNAKSYSAEFFGIVYDWATACNNKGHDYADLLVVYNVDSGSFGVASRHNLTTDDHSFGLLRQYATEHGVAMFDSKDKFVQCNSTKQIEKVVRHMVLDIVRAQ